MKHLQWLLFQCPNIAVAVAISLLHCNVTLCNDNDLIWCWLVLVLLAASFSLCCESLWALHTKVLVLIAWGTHFRESSRHPSVKTIPPRGKMANITMVFSMGCRGVAIMRQTCN